MARRARKPITLEEYELAIGDFKEGKVVPFLPTPAGLAIETLYQLTTDDEIPVIRKGALQILSKSGKILLGDSRSALNEVIDVVTGAKELNELLNPKPETVPVEPRLTKRKVPRRRPAVRRLN